MNVNYNAKMLSNMYITKLYKNSIISQYIINLTE